MLLSRQKITVKNKNRFFPALIRTNKKNEDNNMNNKNRNQPKKNTISIYKKFQKSRTKSKTNNPHPLKNIRFPFRKQGVAFIHIPLVLKFTQFFSQACC